MSLRHMASGLAAAVALAAPVCADAQNDLSQRWVYSAHNMQVSQNVETLTGLMRRASAVGYTGFLLADFKFNVLNRVPGYYFDHVAAVRQEADALGIELFPAIAGLGYSEGILTHNPNLAEGEPVRNALFVAQNGTADLVADPPVSLPGGDFENATNNRFAGWDYQDGIGVSTFADRTIFHGGSQSLRMEDPIRGNDSGNCRVYRRVTVSPYRQYHLSAWVKTQNLDSPGSVAIQALDGKGRPLTYNTLSVASTQEWKQVHVVFNSLDNTEALIYLGIWSGRYGKLWWDDAVLEEVGLLNVLRRPGCPLAVVGEDGTAYAEGLDFESVQDERMGTVPYSGNYEVYHKPPTIRLTPGSRIPNGARLRVAFHHAVIVYQDQVACCLSEPAVYDILQEQIARVNDLLQPRRFFLNIDELRVANWCDACAGRGLSPGQLLADALTRLVAMIRQINPGAEIWTWSDMFDPYHNAVDSYYLVNGSWAGSWEGLTPDIGIANWNFGKLTASLNWFAALGNPQLIAGYYDSNPGRIRQQLDQAAGTPGLVGVMYTTWQSRYTDLEAFAQAAWGQ